MWLQFNDGRKGLVDLADELHGAIFEPLRDRVLGRIVAEDVFLPGNDEDPFVTRNQLLDEAWVQKLEDASVQAIKVRSTITCASSFGVLSELPIHTPTTNAGADDTPKWDTSSETAENAKHGRTSSGSSSASGDEGGGGL